MTEHPPPDQAMADIETAQRSMSAAHTRHAAPRWLPPTAGVLFAAGCITIALGAHSASKGVYLVAGIVLLLLFLITAAMAARYRGIMLMPARSRRATLIQLASLVPIVATGIAAVTFGFSAALITLGIGLGTIAWLQLSRYSKDETT